MGKITIFNTDQVTVWYHPEKIFTYPEKAMKWLENK